MYLAWRTGLKRLANILLLSLLLIEGLPELGPAHRGIRQHLDWIVDKTGLWQGSWKLFAPQVDKINVAISAEITFSDSSVQTWRSPDWSKMGPIEKNRYFRHMEYYDNMRLDKHRAVWRSFAEYLVRTIKHDTSPGLKVVSVKLIRHWTNIAPPRSNVWVAPLNNNIAYNNSYTFAEYKF